MSVFLDPKRSKPPVWRIVLYTLLLIAVLLGAGYFIQ